MSKNHTLVAFVKTTYHFFPNLLSWINTIKDPRDTAKTNYPLKDLILVGLLLFIFKLGARRQIKFRLNDPILIKNLQCVFQYKSEKMSHAQISCPFYFTFIFQFPLYFLFLIFQGWIMI